MSFGKVVKKVVIWSVVAFVVMMVIGIVAAMFSSDDSSTSSSPAPAQQSYGIGDTMKADKVAFIITSVKILKSVGDEYMNSSASEGASYVAVQFKYKNISGSSIGMFSKPTVSLLDPSGNSYGEDLNASTYYSSQIGDDEKILSDLNPGITVKSCTVFEVSEELLQQTGWRLMVESDDSSFKVNVK